MSSVLQNKKAVEKAIEGASSTREALERLGLRAAGGNYAAFKAACNKFNLEQPKATGFQQTQTARKQNKFLLSSILVKDSTYTNRANIKRRCYETGRLKEICYQCGIGPNWNGKKLTLQLEHKNGVHNDHRLNNLEILCPNCHSQTPTYAGRKSN